MTQLAKSDLLGVSSTSGTWEGPGQINSPSFSLWGGISSFVAILGKSRVYSKPPAEQLHSRVVAGEVWLLHVASPTSRPPLPFLPPRCPGLVPAKKESALPSLSQALLVRGPSRKRWAKN